jgi:hypothetical protein
VRALTGDGQLAEADLVQDLAGLLVAKVVVRRALARGQGRQRGPGQLRPVREHLVARDQAVAAEQRHEPRQPGGGQAHILERGLRVEAQGGEVGEAALIHLTQRVVVGLQRRSVGQPGGKLVEPFAAQFGQRARAPPRRVRAFVLVGVGGDHEGDPVLCARRKRQVQPNRVVLDRRRLADGDTGFANEAAVAVAQHQFTVAALGDDVAPADLLVLYLEQIGEVGRYLEVDGHGRCARRDG